MFSLVIAIISILLVIALGLATVYYLSGGVTSKGDEAAAARILNESAQIKGALETYNVQKGGYPTGTGADIKAALVSSNYLSAFPNGANWELTTGGVQVTGISEAQCKAVNLKLLGSESIPSCADPALPDSACCTE